MSRNGFFKNKSKHSLYKICRLFICTPFSEIDGTHPENDCTLEIFTWHKYNFEMAHLLDLLGTFSK
jgi:hypothetical protein